MAITWGWIRNQKLSNQLAIIYTAAFTIVLGISFLIIYAVSEDNREDEFYKRMKDRANSTFRMIVEDNGIDSRMMHVFDHNTINNLSNESVSLFDSSGKLIYSSDTTNISYATPMLDRLKSRLDLLEVTDNDDQLFEMNESELIGMRLQHGSKKYFAVIKAYDKFGVRKINFLALLLLITFTVVTIFIVFLSFFLSRILTEPISHLTRSLERLSPYNLSSRVHEAYATDEVGFLASKFNELLNKIESVLSFQTNYINHISHELKNPLAIMMANVECSLVDGTNCAVLVASMQFQKMSIMELSLIIDALLDISKAEQDVSYTKTEAIRIDDVLFECMAEENMLSPNLCFNFDIETEKTDLDMLVSGNRRMIKMAVMNVVRNSVRFSVTEQPSIVLTIKCNEVLIKVENDGLVVAEEERNMLFRQSFRGSNSAGVKGFGMGLVLTGRIIKLHKGSIEYGVSHSGKNSFLLRLPISS